MMGLKWIVKIKVDRSGRPGAVALLILLSGLPLVEGFGQSRDSAARKADYKNIIKVNLTSNILYRSPLVEYERVVSPNQSFSVQFGLVALPFGSSRGSDSLYYESTLKKAGFSVTADYRFY